jgi:hypothetical protein
MTTSKIFKGGLIALTSFGLILTSCTKNADDSTTVAENHSMAEQSNDELDAIGDEAETSVNNKLASFKNENTSGILADSVHLTKIVSSDTVSVVVDFGTNGVTCKDGKSRKGKIKIKRIGNPFNQGSIRTLVTEGYSVDGNTIEATRTVTFNGLQATNQHPSWTITAEHTITLANGAGTITGSTTRTREWSKGYEQNSLLNREDDEFVITGTSNGSKASGVSYEMEITTPLTIKVACHQIISGVLVITPSGKLARTIDFGTGDCDGTATVTIGKTSKTVTIKK